MRPHVSFSERYYHRIAMAKLGNIFDQNIKCFTNAAQLGKSIRLDSTVCHYFMIEKTNNEYVIKRTSSEKAIK